MKLLIPLFTFLLLSSGQAHALWSCVNKDGKLLDCDSPGFCRKYYLNCQKFSEVKEEESVCNEPKCSEPKPFVKAKGEEFDSKEPISPPKTDSIKTVPSKTTTVKNGNQKSKQPMVVSKDSLPPDSTKPAPTSSAAAEPKRENSSALADFRLSQLKSMVSSKAKSPVTAKAQRPAAGLTEEEEQKLFGNPEVNAAAQLPQDNPWLSFMSETTHKRLVDELRKNRKLREELKKKLASMPLISTEDKETKAMMQSMLAEAELKAKEMGKSLDDVDPLSAKEAFQLEDEEVEELRRRGATK